ncbi:MAG TPA: hypothetical protein VEQ18_01055, partial [Candidatus Nitrosocosmicus sp.]|nr:hypothetical protein [Candidatus Nitrosocosmicus sp.]
YLAFIQSNGHQIFEGFSYFINRFPEISDIIQQYTGHRACYRNIVPLKNQYQNNIWYWKSKY